METADLAELQKARDSLLKAIDKRVQELVEENKKKKVQLRPTSSTKTVKSPKKKINDVSNTVLVENIPDEILRLNTIIARFKKFGDIERLELLEDEDGELIGSAYITFEDPDVAKDLVDDRFPFKTSSGDQRRIKVSPVKYRNEDEE